MPNQLDSLDLRLDPRPSRVAPGSADLRTCLTCLKTTTVTRIWPLGASDSLPDRRVDALQCPLASLMTSGAPFRHDVGAWRTFWGSRDTTMAGFLAAWWHFTDR